MELETRRLVFEQCPFLGKESKGKNNVKRKGPLLPLPGDGWLALIQQKPIGDAKKPPRALALDPPIL